MSKVKLVVWDLDNTLWKGTVFYKDKENIRLKEGTIAALKELNKRNIKNAICSRNNEIDVKEQLEKFGIGTYFDFVEVNWDRKSESIKRISEESKLLYSEMIFVDDDPFQREEVRINLPGIKVIELKDPIDILSLEEVEIEGKTLEDEERIRLLKEQRERIVAEKINRGDFKDFLRGCNIQVTIRPIEEKDWSRAVQLFNRTNELNTTGSRFILEELKKECEKDSMIFVVDMKDKFGDYGLIGESLIKKEDSIWFIKDIAISCRTMGRGIGSALVISILDYAKESKIHKVTGRIIETKDNWRLKPLFINCGFKETENDGKIALFEFNIDNKFFDYPDWLKIERRET